MTDPTPINWPEVVATYRLENQRLREEAKGLHAAAFDEAIEFAIAEIDNLPDGWCWWSHWKKEGYNQCRNRLANLLAYHRQTHEVTPPHGKERTK